MDFTISVLVFFEVLLLLYPKRTSLHRNRIFDIKNNMFFSRAIRKAEVFLENKIRLSGMEEKTSPRFILNLQGFAAIAGWIAGSAIYCSFSGDTGIIAGFIMAVLFAYYPVIWLDRKIRERKTAVIKELPSFLTDIAVVTDSGMNLQQALIEVSKSNKGIIGGIFEKAVQKTDMGKQFIDALEDIPELFYIEELGRTVSVMTQALKKGSTGITKLLREQALVCWNKRKNELKEQGQKASFKLFLPVYLLVFPAVGLMVLTPAIMSILKVFSEQ